MFQKILIANRGEIACRVIRSAHKMGIRTCSVFSDADRQALHVATSDEAIRVGRAPAAESYISIPAIMEAVASAGADAVHPGYGFLSENSSFAEALDEAGVTFIGPPASAIEAMGDKIESKRIAAEANVSIIPGSEGQIETVEEAVGFARSIGYPVMIKASAGGGGKGMRVARSDDEVREGFRVSRSEAASSFGDNRVFIERYITGPRHIEIQVLGDKHGNHVYLNERECSIQRRNQKVIEEAPSPFVSEELRRRMGEQALSLARAVGYYSAGTVEFIVDSSSNFYFLEMNTRLQVEHPVTELTTGIDIVEQMIRIAAGEPLELVQSDIGVNGWAIESRIYAENPSRNFLPSTGRLRRYRPPADSADDTHAVRVDTGVYEGGEISVHYDPMIAKLCSWAPDRSKAVEVMRNSLDVFELEGIESNIPFLSTVLGNEKFLSGDITTAFIEEEFPEGFHGNEMPEHLMKCIVACAAVMHRHSEIRSSRISGRMSHHGRHVGSSWTVVTSGTAFRVKVNPFESGSDVEFEDGLSLRVTSDWHPGQPLAILNVDQREIKAMVDPIPNGYRFRYRGSDLHVQVFTHRQAELARYMAVKTGPDESNQLLCPMPGLIVSVAVKDGDVVEAGQEICTMEAMKMENVLKAIRKATVKRVLVNAGDTVAIDDVIVEFD